jgi:ABC-type nitrate/sulfonate/bicarbonate transport system permease component
MTAIDAPRAEIMGMPRARAVTLTRWAIIIAAAVALELYARFFGDPAFVQPVSAVLRAWVNPILSDERILWALGLAVMEIAVAYAMSIFFGALIGMTIGASNFARASFLPIVLLLYAIPQVSLMPLFVLFFGLGAASKIAFGFSHGIFPIIVNVVAGMRDINPLYLRGAQSMGASRLDVFRHVIFPNMVPSFFVGLRLAMTLTLLGVILAELYVSTGGIGYFTRVYAESYNPAPLFALIGSLALIAVLFNSLVRVAERRLTPGRAMGARKISGAKSK